MARKTYSPEQINRKLREAEVYIGESMTAIFTVLDTHSLSELSKPVRADHDQ